MNSFTICPNCGSTVSSDAQVCPVCGYQLRTDAGANAETNNAASQPTMPTQPIDQNTVSQPGNEGDTFVAAGNAVPPVANDNGGVAAGNNPGVPPVGNTPGVPPAENNNGFMPADNNPGLTPAGNNGGIPPVNNTPGVPPVGNNGGQPPMGNNNGMTPMGNNGGMPTPPKRRGLAPWLIALIAVLSVALVVGGFFLFKSLNSVRNFSGSRFKAPTSYAVKFDVDLDGDKVKAKSEGVTTTLDDLDATAYTKASIMFTFYPDGSSYMMFRERNSSKGVHALTIFKGTYTINKNKIEFKTKGGGVRRVNKVDEELVSDKDVDSSEVQKSSGHEVQGESFTFEIKGNDLVATNAFPGGDAKLVKMDKPAKPIKNATGKYEPSSMYKHWFDLAGDETDPYEDDDEDEDTDDSDESDSDEDEDSSDSDESDSNDSEESDSNEDEEDDD